LLLLCAVTLTLAAPAKRFRKELDLDYVIELKDKLDMGSYQKYLKTLPRKERHQVVYDALSGHAATIQADLVAFLEEKGIPHKAHWINNAVYAHLTSVQVADIARRVDVGLVRPAGVGHIIAPAKPENVTVAVRDQWNIDIINAPAAQAIADGDGVVVSNIDTGVRWTHVSLIDSYRGNPTNNHNYNWFDPTATREPVDNNGHGTHTMGTIAGTENGIGVAPGAKWIAAKGCRTALCPEADLTASAEWVLCPTDLSGANPDCSLGADIVSNSWGGGQGDAWYLPYTEAWRDAGMIPVFAMGNAGPACGTANSPGDLYNVIGVGATDSADRLASFSSRGPGNGTPNFPAIKPDISAPGASVVSASSASDVTYTTLSGTSMACPAVAGVAALMLSANPSMDYDELYDIMTSTADEGVGAPIGGQTACGGIAYTTFPNNHYGYGRVDAYAAVAASRVKHARAQPKQRKQQRKQ